MKLFRHRRVLQFIVCSFLLEFGGALAFPAFTWATAGPGQVEFTNYQRAGATDMVNLTTGDFSYNIPILDIPGPERSFSLPLTYASGIQLEEEASWVGLGWSLNAGAIARTINGYADDAADELVQVKFQKYFDVRSRDLIIPGIYTRTWSLVNGGSGSIDLLGLASLNWNDNGLTGGDLVGIGFDSGEFKVDGQRTVSAVMTIASFGAASGVSLAANIGISTALTIASTTAMAAYSVGRLGGMGGFNNQPHVHEDCQNLGTQCVWDIFITNDASEHAYGSLHFGKLSQNTMGTPSGRGQGPTVARRTANGTTRSLLAQFSAQRSCQGVIWQHGLTEVGSDIYQSSDPDNESYYGSSKHPISIAHDNFRVMGGNATGSIRPYRMDVGSVVNPKIGTVGDDGCQKQQKYMTIPFVDESIYKVGFRYEGELSNTYNYHDNGQNSGFEVINNELTITDSRLLDANARIEAVRKGISLDADGKPRLVQGKHTEWYTNAEIEQMTTTGTGLAKGFVDFTARPGTANAFRHALPPNGIGAFAVTTEDGTTYHYSLPVMHYKTFTTSVEQDYSGTAAAGFYRRKEGTPSTANPHGGYATSWLLTAITSADYIDRNQSGSVDATDWGGWVKFDYGKFSDRYKWRQPYIGYAYNDRTTNYASHAEGYKETYYLDKISTRSHTALFVKSMRLDARGHFTGLETPNAELDIREKFPASSLRLDEIVLLDNATLAKLETVDGIRASGAASTPALSNNTNSHATSNSCDCGDDFTRVLDTEDFTADSRIKTFVEANALKRIHFNYGYDLCRDSPNAFAYQQGSVSSLPSMQESGAATGRSGKLTLKSVSFYGPTIGAIPTKIIPDFVFGYEENGVDVHTTNPAFSKEKWDAFGAYNPDGRHNTTSHKPNSYGPVAPWTLRKITSPLGGSTQIKYERDQYAQVSEYGSKNVTFDFFRGQTNNYAPTFTLAAGASISGSLTDYVRPNDYILVNGGVWWGTGGFNPNSGYTPGAGVSIDNKLVRVESVTANAITIRNADMEALTGLSGIWTSGAVFDTPGRFIFSMHINTTGGDVRVASITSSALESGEQYLTKYQYTNANASRSNSTGVLAKEPGFLNKVIRPFESIYDYPNTSVLYSKVTALSGKLSTDNDYQTRVVYEFYTPTSDMVAEQTVENYVPFSGMQAEDFNNHVTVKTGLIGQPKAISLYNKRGQREIYTTFDYGGQNSGEVTNTEGIANQGQFTEGVVENELLDYFSFRINRTTKKYLPTVMTATHTTRNGVTVENNNELYDFLTGQVLGTRVRDSKGRIFHSLSVPAYTVAGNSTMGPKGAGVGNSNMLVQPAAQYTLVEKPGQTGYNVRDPFNPRYASVMSAGIQTWQRNWSNYRIVGTNGEIQDDPSTQQPPIWRQKSNYAWQSSVLNTDGSYGAFTPFDWSGAAIDNHWIKAKEVVRYDHFSHQLEQKDANGLYSTLKTGHSGTQEIMAASPARYTETAFSGAEDGVADANGLKYFGGDVISNGSVAEGTQSTVKPHTGRYYFNLTNSTNKLYYRGIAGGEISTAKPYRLGAWVHGSDLISNAGRLYASVNGTMLAEASITTATTRKAGNWYRLTLDVTIPNSFSGQTVEFGCKNTAATPVFFDDFRVSPATAAMNSKVYDPRTNRAIYTLDNENLFTRYDYNAIGQLLQVSKEGFDKRNDPASNVKLLKEYAYNFSQLYMPTWISDQYACATDASGNNNGIERRHVVDVNPLNNPPTPSKWEDNGQSASCARPACQMRDYDSDQHWTAVRRLRGNYCEEAIPGQPTCVQRVGGSGVYDVTIIWEYPNSNGDTEIETYSSTLSCGVLRGAKKVKTKPLKSTRPLSSTIRTK